jgi:ankyrin repeat protein
VQQLLRAWADFDKPNNDGETPLHAAAAFGHVEVVQDLLLAGANKTTFTKEGKTPLLVAGARGHKAVVDALLATDAVVSSPWTRASDLYEAVEAENMPLALELLKSPSLDREWVNPKTLWSPLTVACSKGSKEFVNMLLMARVSRRGVLNVASALGRTDIVLILLLSGEDPNEENGAPLSTACSNGHEPIAALLLRAGADPNGPSAPLISACAAGNRAIVELLLRAGADKERPNTSDETPLIAAAVSGNTAIMKLLLSFGTDVNGANSGGTTALHMAAHTGQFDSLQFLLQHGAKHDVVNQRGDTPLHNACVRGRIDVVEALIAAGANLNKANTLGETPLSAASGRYDIAFKLLRAGAAPTLSTLPADTTVLVLLIMFNIKVLPQGWNRSNVLTKCAELMTKRGDRFVFEIVALGCPLLVLKSVLSFRIPPSIFSSIDASIYDVDTRDAAGETALHWAASRADAETVEVMVSKGFDVNAREFTRGKTPLFCARTPEIALKLVELGADPDIYDTYGLSARDTLGKGLLSGLPQSLQLQLQQQSGAGSISKRTTKVVTMAIQSIEGHPLRSYPGRTATESIILVCTLNEATPRPA